MEGVPAEGVSSAYDYMYALWVHVFYAFRHDKTRHVGL